MYGKITILFIISSLLLTNAVRDALKCYMCTSLKDPQACGHWLNTSAVQTTYCTEEAMSSWRVQNRQHENLNGLIKNLETIHNVNFPVTCAKMVLRRDGNKEDVIVRTCVTNDTTSDTCEMMKQKEFGKMTHCSLCLKDACNGTTALSFEIFNLYLASLIFILFTYYR